MKRVFVRRHLRCGRPVRQHWKSLDERKFELADKLFDLPYGSLSPDQQFKVDKLSASFKVPINERRQIIREYFPGDSEVLLAKANLERQERSRKAGMKQKAAKNVEAFMRHFRKEDVLIDVVDSRGNLKRRRMTMRKKGNSWEYNLPRG